MIGGPRAGRRLSWACMVFALAASALTVTSASCSHKAISLAPTSIGVRFWGEGKGGAHTAAAARRNFYVSPSLPSAGGKQQNGTCGTHKSPALSHGCGSPCQALLLPMPSRHHPQPGPVEGHPRNRGCDAGVPAIPRESTAGAAVSSALSLPSVGSTEPLPTPTTPSCRIPPRMGRGGCAGAGRDFSSVKGLDIQQQPLLICGTAYLLMCQGQSEGSTAREDVGSINCSSFGAGATSVCPEVVVGLVPNVLSNPVPDGTL